MASRAAFLVALMLVWVPVSECSKGAARKEDIPYIKCQVCQKLAHQLYHQVQAKQAEITPKKISEYQIIEMSENVCNLKKREADWILKIDIVERGDRLELVEHESEGQCISECKTIERACQEVMGYSDTDVAEFLYSKKPGIDSFATFLCKDLTGSCNKQPPRVPKDRTPGEPFVPKSSKEAEMERLLKSMEGMPGAPGMKMYSRDDLMKQNFGDGDDDADEDEDADEEEHFPSKLGKALREKEKNARSEWKERIAKGVLGAGEAVKSRVNSLSKLVGQWWKSKQSLKNKKAEL